MSDDRVLPEQRIVCDDCGATFKYRWDWEVSLPPHNCSARRARRGAQ